MVWIARLFQIFFGKQGDSTYEYLVFVFVFVFCPYPRFSPFSIFGELGGSSYEYLDRVEFQCMVGKQTVRLLWQFIYFYKFFKSTPLQRPIGPGL